MVQELSALQLRQHHKEELRAQMAANEERQKRQHAEYLLEGEKTRQKLQAEKDFIEVRPSCFVAVSVISLKGGRRQAAGRSMTPAASSLSCAPA